MTMRTSTRVRAERKPQRVSTALRDTFREVLLLARLRLRDLTLVKVSFIQPLVERFETETLDNIDRVNDVSEGLAHLSSVGITNHSMTVNLFERHFACEVNTKQDHTRHPEEDNVPTGFQDR